MSSAINRCAWANGPSDYERYHDEEWGRALTGDAALFERVCLEGFQAGLSWLTVLRKREAFREALDNFDPQKLAQQGEREVQRHLQNAALIRHRGKLEAALSNARALVRAWDEHGPTWLYDTFSAHAPSEESLRAQGYPRPPASLADLPAATEETKRLSKLLRSRGFRFVGPTTLYAAMQASGFVSDHVSSCFLANAR